MPLVNLSIFLSLSKIFLLQILLNKHGLSLFFILSNTNIIVPHFYIIDTIYELPNRIEFTHDLTGQFKALLV